MDIYQVVTDKIIAMLERADHGEWRMPWHSYTRILDASDGSNVTPRNIDGRPYRGINIWLLLAEGRDSNVWGTYRAWQQVGANVRKGEKGTLVIYWAQAIKKLRDEETGEIKNHKYLIAKGYTVFNSEQVENWTPKAITVKVQRSIPERIEAAETFFASKSAVVNHGGSRAFYSPSADQIQMPEFAQFKSAEGYYATLAHEFIHWTGHESRCAREFGKRFGDDAHAMEELVAELGSAFLCATLEITNDPLPDHAAYLAHWLRTLKADKRAIFTAASKAQTAADFLLADAALPTLEAGAKAPATAAAGQYRHRN